ncbi:MAG: M20/M25/M40 family metallo-hydrolase [Candidatus Micrarchaeota archaeon]|nr:M20/M25/M40 family metallo-hydrolase [Candidatus Micrarchaeota archaeon]
MERDSEALSLLRKLISINSVFPQERALAEFCSAYLKRYGFSVRLQKFAPNRFNVIAQKGSRKGAVLLSAHLDTVPPYNYGKRDPLRMEMRGDTIRGLGSWDMKSGLSLVLLCAKYCDTSERGMRIVLTADEENISEGTWAAQKSGEYRNCSVAICHEIPDAPQDASKGKPPIILGRRGRAVYRFTVTGIGAHGAGSTGVSAIDLGNIIVRALSKIPMPTGKLGPSRLFVRRFSSESRSLSVPTEAVIDADVHYVPPHTPQSFLAHIKRHLRSVKFPAGCNWSVEIPKRKTPYLPSYETDEKNATVRRFLSLYCSHIGKPAISYGLTVADENILSVEKMPIITLGPAGGEAHSSKEWVSKSDFLRLAAKVPLIVQEMLC